MEPYTQTTIAFIEGAIRRLREVSLDPFTIKCSDQLSVEIYPHDEPAERVNIIRKGLGYTIVNYREVGGLEVVVVDEDGDDLMMHGFDNEDLAGDTSDTPQIKE